MSVMEDGADRLATLRPIDCDIHVRPPETSELLPYLNDFWRDMAVVRGIDGLGLAGYPATPASVRPDWRGPANEELSRVKAHLDRYGLRAAIINCMHGCMALTSDDLGQTFSRAVNDWLADKWLGADSRLRASLVVNTQDPARAAEEIESRADDRRFVQVLLLAKGDRPLGRRNFWPIYAAAEKHGFAVAIHAGGYNHLPPTSSGWPSYAADDEAGQVVAVQSQLASMLSEGVFQKFPNLRVVASEVGFTWVPNWMWRANKTWRGTRIEMPWVDRDPSAIMRDNIRVTLQPSDAPPDPKMLERVLDHIDAPGMILFSTDYPHWQYEGDAVVPDGVGPELLRRMAVDNPLNAYPRMEAIQ